MAVARSTARRYAEAAFEIAERDDSMEAWVAAMTTAEQRLTEPDVLRLLSNPAIPASSRIAVLDRLVAGDIGRVQRNMLALLVRRGRFEQLPVVVREFTRLYRDREGIVEAIVTASSALDKAELEALGAKLQTMTGKRIELRQTTDPELLGGIQVRVGDQLIDGSVKGRLERLRTDLANIAI